MDNLSRDSTAALKAGMSYGMWKALHPHTKREAEQTAEDERLCQRCGKPIPKGSRKERKYCSDKCKQAADKARYGNKYRKEGSPELKKNNKRKLTAEEVMEAKNEWFTKGTPYRVLADRYGVSDSTMQRAIRGVTWQSLEDDDD